MRNKFRVGVLKIRFSLNQPYNINSSSKLWDVFYEQYCETLNTHILY